jgi:hypothetical protein
VGRKQQHQNSKKPKIALKSDKSNAYLVFEQYTEQLTTIYHVRLAADVDPKVEAH